MNSFWFMGALTGIYILFPALKALFDKSEKAFLFFTVTCAIFTFGLRALHYPAINMFNPFNSYGYSFVYFCVGGLIYKYENKIILINRIKRNILAVLGMLLMCACLFFIGVFLTKSTNEEIWDVVWNGYDTIFTFFNVIFIYILCLNYHRNNVFIKNISSNTLGIYFTHALIIRSTRPWIKTQDALCNLPVNLLYSSLIIVICLLFCLLLRKIPLLKKMI